MYSKKEIVVVPKDCLLTVHGHQRPFYYVYILLGIMILNSITEEVESTTGE